MISSLVSLVSVEVGIVVVGDDVEFIVSSNVWGAEVDSFWKVITFAAVVVVKVVVVVVVELFPISNPRFLLLLPPRLLLSLLLATVVAVLAAVVSVLLELPVAY